MLEGAIKVGGVKEVPEKSNSVRLPRARKTQIRSVFFLKINSAD